MIKSIFKTTVVTIFALLLMSQSCEKKNENDKTEITENAESEKQEMEMLKYTYTGTYSDLWAKVDSLEKEGLYKSALDVVDTIFSNAQAEKNAPQIVKAVIFRMKYNSYLEEDDFINALANHDIIQSEQ